MLIAALFIGPIVAPSATIAASSDWAKNEGGRMRLVITATDQPGRYDGMLQIEPKPGWMTYWREPGDSGIPPELTFDEQSGVRVTEMRFPAPKRIDNGPVRDLGYDQAVSLPFQLEAPKAAAGQLVTAQAFVGICQNICIPFQAEFRIELPVAAEAMDAIQVAQARQTLPEAPSDEFGIDAVRRADDGSGLLIAMTLPNSEQAPVLYVTGGAGIVTMDSRVEDRSDGTAVLFVPITTLPEHGDPEGKIWRVLAIAGDRSMESPLAFE
ncbi:cytochrome C biogenesis protein [Ciceribacter sp. L1K23]|uniref:protein-disulfide reductase DsbD domain-containing protein n=1 Tax=Ciceribacter sp. L1K23 TaxID=2820276 RepID=UPI001B838A73|nr:protein-disulfide reductase DsbD domain-containing protein [Ciceribacter sp. L1K23]MBR0556685.1 cytochrome C biogenesis protein [Ciceribacter sp. L1K23]